MYAFESSHKRTGIHSTTIACFVAAFALFGVSNMEGMAFPLIYQCSGLVLLAMGIYFLTRYILKKYTYEISESHICDAAGLPILDLVITETKGKRHVVVARVALRDITQVVVIDKSKDKNTAKEQVEALRQNPQGVPSVVFRYLSTPLPSQACYIAIPSENSVLVIPYNQKMVQYLTQSIQ